MHGPLNANLIALFHSTHTFPACPSDNSIIDDRQCGALVEWCRKEGTSICRGTTVSTTNATWANPWLNPVFRGARLATSSMNHGTDSWRLKSFSVFSSSVPTSQRSNSVRVTKTIWFMPCAEIVAVNSDTRMALINTPFGHNSYIASLSAVAICSRWRG